MDIKVSQMTVVCHMYDLKVPQKDLFEVTSLDVYLTDNDGGLKVNCGKVNDYLGMDLD